VRAAPVCMRTHAQAGADRSATLPSLFLLARGAKEGIGYIGVCVFFENQMLLTVDMEKIIKKYRLDDAEKQEEEDLKYWALASTAEKTEVAYSLWEECYWIQKGININAQRLRRVLEIAKLPQS